MTPRKTPSHLLTPGEAAAMFRVDVRTVRRWAKEGRVTSIQTVGGTSRYVRAEIEKLATDWRRT